MCLSCARWPRSSSSCPSACVPYAPCTQSSARTSLSWTGCISRPSFPSISLCFPLKKRNANLCCPPSNAKSASNRRAERHKLEGSSSREGCAGFAEFQLVVGRLVCFFLSLSLLSLTSHSSLSSLSLHCCCSNSSPFPDSTCPPPHSLRLSPLSSSLSLHTLSLHLKTPFTMEEQHSPPKVLISGGGLAGLFLAILLERACIPYHIFERAPKVKPLGTGMEGQRETRQGEKALRWLVLDPDERRMGVCSLLS